MNTATFSLSDWIVPQWPAPQWVRAICTTRQGGVSLPPFDSMNLGDHVQDDARSVATNRELLAERCDMEPVFLQQVHGTQVTVLQAGSPDAEATKADASVTTVPGIACLMMVADCLPVLLTHRTERIVGAAHAGWRGLSAGVLESLLATMRKQLPGVQDDWLAWLGPCIGQQAFEVGDEVRKAFCDDDIRASHSFVAGQAPGKWQADLAALARLRLQRMGITSIHGNDGSPEWCTWSQPDRFYSYRRASRTGRFGAAIWVGN